MLDSIFESGSFFPSRCMTATFLLLLAIGATPGLSGQCRQGSWCVRTKTDPITETMTSNIALTVPTESNSRRGEAEVTATCGSDPNNQVLSFTIDYHSPSDRNPKFETSVPDSSIMPDAEDATVAYEHKLYAAAAGGVASGGIQGLAEGILGVEQSAAQGIADEEQEPSMVKFRARIDHESVIAWSRDKYSNELMLSFFDGWEKLDILGPPFGKNEMPPAGSLSQGFKAHSILVELPLVNGDRPIVDIRLDDPVFRKFAAACPIPHVAPPPPPPSPKDYLQDAKSHMVEHQYEAARTNYKQVLALDPGNAEASAGITALEGVEKRQQAFLESLDSYEIWLEPQSQLMWTTRDSEKALFAGDAYVYCGNHEFGGLSGWRLPTLPELQSIYDPQGIGTYHNKGGIELSGKGGWVWVYSDGNQYLRFFSLTTGRYNEQFGYDYANFAAHAVCVRPYQPDQDGLNNSPSAVASVVPPAPSDHPPSASNPNDAADAYYVRGMSLLLGSPVDAQTGKVNPLPGCESDFLKYLELAPNGGHALQVEEILKNMDPKAVIPQQPTQFSPVAVSTPPVTGSSKIGQLAQANRLASNPMELAVSCDNVTSLSSPTSTTSVRLKIVNSTRAVRMVYWISYTGQKLFYMKIPPESFYRQSTFAGHVWLVTDPYGRCVDAFRAGSRDAEERIDR